MPQIPAPDPWPGTDYRFCFWNVSGGSLSPGGPPVPVTVYNTSPTPAAVPSPAGIYVGDLPITLLAVYALAGPGGGNGPPGATIDQLDLSTNLWISDTFVTVSPDPTGALTKTGNVEGFVDTTSREETITALPTTSPTGVDFVAWTVLSAPVTPSASAALTVGQGDSVSALALYQAPPDNLGTISGTITYDSDGGIYPLGATVTANPGGTTQSSASDGTFVLTNLQPGTVQVTVQLSLIQRRFYTPAVSENTVTVVAGETVTLNFRLVRKGTIF